MDFDGAANMSRSDASASPSSPPHRRSSSSDSDLGFGERALSAAGAAFLSAILVNPLDVAKVKLDVNAGVCSCIKWCIGFNGFWSYKRDYSFIFGAFA